MSLPAPNEVKRSTDIAVLSCFFLTGALALVYEICWIRKATLVFGAASFALSTVLAVFFAGLAIGSFLLGKRAGRSTRPLRLYAMLEVGVAVLALVSPALFVAGDAIYARVYPAVFQNFALLSLIRFLLLAVIMLGPTILMGGTLPLLCRHFVRKEQSIARSVGFVYGLNTLGAAVGAAACGLCFIRFVGVNRTIYLAGAINLVLALFVWRLSKIAAAPPTDDSTRRDESSGADPLREENPGGRVMPALFFVTGFIALGNEVLWTRFLSLLMRNTVYTYTLTLSVILIGIVLGSALTALFADRLKHRAMVFGVVQVAIGVTVLTVLLLPAAWWMAWRDSSQLSTQLTIIALILLPPAILSGMAYPLAIRIVVAHPAGAGWGVGMMTALNTAGGITGALVIGFGALPLLGMHYTLLLTTGLSLAAGFAAWCALEHRVTRQARAALIIVAFAAWLAVPNVTGTRLPADFLTGNGRLVAYREGLSSFMAVLHRRSMNQLEIDRMWQGENRKNHQIMAAHIPMLHHSQPRDVLVIGIGAGQTAGRLLMHPSVERLDCVDIESKLAPLIREHFDTPWLDDPRTRVVVEDGRNFLTYTDRRYDVISIEVGQAFRPTVASFYTADFYRHAREKLNSGGVISQFVPIGFFSTDHFRVVIRTFLAVFPNSVLWYNSSELLLIGSVDGDPKITRKRLAELESDAALMRDLEYSYWGGPKFSLNQSQVLMGGFLAGPKGLGRMGADAPVYRDDLPYLEYTTSTKSAKNEEQIVALIRTCLDPPGDALDTPPTPQAAGAIETIRAINLNDILASLHGSAARVQLAAGRFEQGLRSLQPAVKLNPRNLWIRNALGMAYRDTGRLQAALEQFQFVLQRDPNQANAHNNMGITLVALDRMQEALPHFRQAVQSDPKLVRARVNLGQALLVSEQPQEAAPHFRAALAVDNADAAAHNGLGMAMAAQGQTRQAIEHFQRAVQLEPGNAAFAGNLQRALRELRLRPDETSRVNP